MTPGMPGPILRLKTGTESATPSVNGIIARNLVRLGTLLEDDEYRTLARQTSRAFSVEILQHPFLFVGLLDAVVGLETGTRQVTGIYCTAELDSDSTRGATTDEEPSQEASAASAAAAAATATTPSSTRVIKPPVSACDVVATQARKEAGLTTSTATTTVAMVDIRPSHAGDIVRNPSFWLRTRNPSYKELKAGDGSKNHLLVCEGAGRCRTVSLS